ncbi:hypothetical protein [Cryobacterium psychrophilum]|uniref:Uncharacterized protein n=1 Tax=Cryobacterium psychrophilum TaxID=41988 RepID=A0A4Y8KSQ6_9MICO|nr:hypothetical protein [Cryobacterium psychrophilum]TDW29648.1 hypothetical protein EDD25_1358 [Cryobacterium psychrophilum]TFD81764.1 hypothetical protein E3T53_01860 [Cryobacterium psychrophilum]
MSGAHRDADTAADAYGLDHTRPPAPPGSELAWESTITAPTEWVPYVYTDAEVHTHTTRRRLSIAALVCGLLGLLLGIIGVWGVFISVTAVILALIARTVEYRARVFWLSGLVAGLGGILLAVFWFLYITQVVLA